MDVPGIDNLSLLWSYLLLVIPLWLAWKWELGITSRALLAVFRMTLQLYLMGFYLGWIFRLNSPWLNLGWLAVMLLVANGAALRQRRLSYRLLFLPTLAGNLLVFVVTLGVFMLLVVRHADFFDARFLIPIGGMLLGNTMRGNIIALEHFYGSLRRDPGTYVTRLLLGATPAEASQPYLHEAMRLTVMPHIASVATVGIVSMPGMMTGQMLAGELPMGAIKYQIAMLIAVFSSMFLAAALSVLFSRARAFDAYGRLKPEVFR